MRLTQTRLVETSDLPCDLGARALEREKQHLHLTCIDPGFLDLGVRLDRQDPCARHDWGLCLIIASVVMARLAIDDELVGHCP